MLLFLLRRRVFEDLRMLKERVKKYKDQVSVSERTISARDAQILKLQDKNQSLSSLLKQSKVSGKEMRDYEGLRQTLERQVQLTRSATDKCKIIGY